MSEGVVTVDPRLVAEINSALSCQWAADAVGALTCLQPGTWLVCLRPVCESGGVVPGLTAPTMATLCTEHCSYLLGGFDRRIRQHLLCGGCGQRWTRPWGSPWHLAEYWEQVAGP